MNRDNSCQQDCRTQNIQRTSKVLTAWGHSLRHLWPQRVNGHPAPSSAPLRGERQAVNPPHAASCRAASVRQGIKCQTVCKPGSVPPPREHGRSFLLADRCRPAPATYPDIWGGDPRTANRARHPYSVLLQAGFTVPSPLPSTRWALTPPFHPYPYSAPLRELRRASPAKL